MCSLIAVSPQHRPAPARSRATLRIPDVVATLRVVFALAYE